MQLFYLLGGLKITYGTTYYFNTDLVTCHMHFSISDMAF
jgi:hypothetical protein